MTDSRTLAFLPLADRPEAADVLARWYLDEWPELFDDVFTPMREIAGCMQRDSIPTTLVAVLGGEVVGAASILVEDVLPLPELSPWLGSVVVSPSHRGRGIGRALVRALMRRAAGLGIEALHLWTPAHRGFYEKLGWTFVRGHPLHGKTVAILRFSLRENPDSPVISV